MPGPGEVSGGQQDAEVGRRRVCDLDEAKPAAAPIGGDVSREFRLVRDRGGEADPPGPGREAVQPRQPEGEQIAALGAGHGMDLVDDHRAQVREHGPGALLRQQQRQTFGGGQQDIGRHVPLAGAGARRRIARAGLDADGEAHRVDRLRQVAGDIGRERLERADIEGVNAGQGRALGRRRAARKVDEAGQKAGERLAATRGRDEEHMFPRPERRQNIELVRARMPAARREPIREGGRQIRWGRARSSGGCEGGAGAHENENIARIDVNPKPRAGRRFNPQAEISPAAPACG
jgi:hypothetical protein